ncbi:hypothetical protein [Anianabacter salinae]|uniref:hypothetical protein n=1 Tax=Anianabacter salinae TaxID=2851023 RepID=UPI00225E1A4C|nr:hypothetical protein [Anianabacter salinae]MBV0913606.1 hypothetical protein [Anianabacter salinae]
MRTVVSVLLCALCPLTASADGPGATIIMEPAIIRHEAAATADQSWVVLLLALAAAVAAVAR